MHSRGEGIRERLGAALEGLTLFEGEEGCGERRTPGGALQRVTSDTLSLADFILPLKDVKTLIELGTGTGALALIAARSDKELRVTGVELHSGAAVCAVANVRSNSLTSRVEIIEQDWRSLYERFPKGSVDLVVSNPPYVKKGTGRISPDLHRAVARHESAGTLRELVELAAYLAGEHGRVAFVYPVGRFCELLGEVQRVGLRLLRLAFVYTERKADVQEDPFLFLVEFGSCGGFKVDVPVFI